MAFQMEGILHKVFDTEQKSERFQAREFVVESEEQYPQFIKFQLVQDKCELIENYNEGDRVKVHFDLRGREWNGKFFTNVNAWRVEAADGSSAAVSTAAVSTAASSSSNASSNNDTGQSAPASAPAAQVDFDDDIPF